MRWEKIALREVADFRNGINFDKSAYSSGVKLIGVSNFGERFSPDYEELQEVDPKVVRSDDFLIDGDIVFVRSNGNKELVGRCMLITEPEYSVTYSGFCIRARIRDTNQYDPTFFTYYFKSSAFRKALSGNAVGTNIQNLSQDRLSSHIAYVPTIEMQRKIASVLSAYDDLIENNQKQIKLLEEAAQRLYKEWFVDLRFPGHETTPIVDGIPQGWERMVLSEVTSVLKRGISPKYSDNGKYSVINQKCIRSSIMDISESRRQEKEYVPTLNLQDSDTVICSTGTGTLGRVGRVYGDYPNTTFDSHVTLVRAKENPNYIYHVVKSQQEYLMGMGRGSTNQQELYRDVIERLVVLCPSQDILLKADRVLNAIHCKIKAVYLQNNLLVESRDRLLPKLISGELEV